MICCAESTPQAGPLGQAVHRIMMVSEELCHLLIEWADVVLDRAPFFKGQFQESPIHGMTCRARAERVAQWVRRGVSGGLPVPPASRDAFHDLRAPAPCGAHWSKQVRDHAGDVDMRFLQQTFQSVVELDAVARELVLATSRSARAAAPRRARSPRSAPARPSASPFVRRQESLSSIRRPPIGLRLRDVERAGSRRGAVVRPTPRCPLPLQRFPHGSVSDEKSEAGEEYTRGQDNSRDLSRGGGVPRGRPSAKATGERRKASE